MFIYLFSTGSLEAISNLLTLHLFFFRFDVKFGKNLEFAYLASFPRSGNTWTRYLIEAATGIFTGTVCRSQFLYDIGNYLKIAMVLRSIFDSELSLNYSYDASGYFKNIISE